jgi:hypothetical protein
MRDDIVIRIARSADPAVARLAALDSAQPLGGALVAEVRGRAVAAVAYDGSRAVADPFEEDAARAVEVLLERSAQLRGQRLAGELRRWRRGERSVRRSERAAAPARRPSVRPRPHGSIQSAALQGR